MTTMKYLYIHISNLTFVHVFLTFIFTNTSGEIKKHNERKVIRRKEVEARRLIIIKKQEEKAKVRKAILEALDYENLVDLDEAMQEATALGLEGKLYQGKKAVGGW